MINNNIILVPVIILTEIRNFNQIKVIISSVSLSNKIHILMNIEFFKFYV